MDSRANFDLGASGPGGMRPAQRPPSEWQKQAIIPQMTREPDQGAMKTSQPTMRGLNPSPGPAADYSRSVLAGRPGVVAQRALAPIPGEVTTVLAQGVGGGVKESLVGGDFVRTAPGNDDNVAGNGDFTGGAKYASGSASKVTGRPVKGSTGGKGMI